MLSIMVLLLKHNLSGAGYRRELMRFLGEGLDARMQLLLLSVGKLEQLVEGVGPLAKLDELGLCCSVGMLE
jgi:hypothetical protein